MKNKINPEDIKVMKLVMAGLLLIFGRTNDAYGNNFKPYTPDGACNAVDRLCNRYLGEDEDL